MFLAARDVHGFVGVHYLGKPVEVEEGDILTFHFTNFTANPQFVYILCLEETGIHTYIHTYIPDWGEGFG